MENSRAPRNIIFAAPDPYPPLRVQEINRKYAAMLKYDMASAGSEMTAITGYLYQSWMLQGEYPQIAVTLQRIAMVEMHHLDLLGKMVKLLGETPSFAIVQEKQVVPWSGRMVFYGKKLEELLQHDLKGEQEAASTYEKQAQNIKDPHVSVLLQRIAMDERIHIKILQDHLAH